MVRLKNRHTRKNLTQKWWIPEIKLGNTEEEKEKEENRRRKRKRRKLVVVLTPWSEWGHCAVACHSSLATNVLMATLPQHFRHRAEALCWCSESKPSSSYTEQCCCCSWLVVCLTSLQQTRVSQGTELVRQLSVLPHWDRSCTSNFLSHPVIVYWDRANKSQCWC